MRKLIILEAASYVAAPVCGRLLTRIGTVYRLKNRGRTYPVLEDGKEEVDNLDFSKADIFITNKRHLSNRGWDYKTLHARYPKLICGYVTGGYGDKPVFDHTAFWAETGFWQSYDTPPTGVADTVCGWMLYAKICECLLTGGTFAEVSLRETAQAMTEVHASQRLQGSPFMRAYDTADGKIMVTIDDAARAKQFCQFGFDLTGRTTTEWLGILGDLDIACAEVKKYV